MINPNQLTNPLIIQSDKTLLLDVHAPLANECRDALIPFAELERSPEHLHTYRLSSLSLWNAASAGFTPDDAIAVLHKFARYEVPQSVEVWIKETAGRFGKLRLIPAPSIEVPVRIDVELADKPNITDKVCDASDAASYSAKTNDTSGKTSDDFADDSAKTEAAEKTEISVPKLIKEEYLYLVTDNALVYKEISSNPLVKKFLIPAEYTEPENLHLKDADGNEIDFNVTENEKKYCFMLR